MQLRLVIRQIDWRISRSPIHQLERPDSSSISSYCEWIFSAQYTSWITAQLAIELSGCTFSLVIPFFFVSPVCPTEGIEEPFKGNHRGPITI